MQSLQGSSESCPKNKCRQLAVEIYLVKFTVNKRNRSFSIWRASPGIVVLTTAVRTSQLFKGFHFLVREENRVFLLLLLLSRIGFFFFYCVDVNGSAQLKIRALPNVCDSRWATSLSEPVEQPIFEWGSGASPIGSVVVTCPGQKWIERPLLAAKW